MQLSLPSTPRTAARVHLPAYLSAWSELIKQVSRHYSVTKIFPLGYDLASISLYWEVSLDSHESMEVIRRGCELSEEEKKEKEGEAEDFSPP